MSAKTILLRAAQKLLGDDRYEAFHTRVANELAVRRYADLFASHPSPRSILFCTPEYCNLGDHAIAYAERRMLAAQSDRPLLEFSGDMTKMLRCIEQYVTPDDVVFLQGGGNMGSLYVREERYRCDILSLLHGNRIVLFPQTISYDSTPSSQRFLNHTRTVYGRKGKDLHLIARERMSLERMREYYPRNDVRLTPDIVLSLTDQATADPTQREGILLCMRNDVEKTTSGQATALIETAAKNTGEPVAYTDTTVDDKYAPISKQRGEELVLGKFDEFRNAKLIVTDRLHGMIFSAVTGTPCIAMDNSTGKVKAEYQWLEDFPYIAFAHDAQEAVDLIPHMANIRVDPAQATALLEGLAPAFDPLRELIH